MPIFTSSKFSPKRTTPRKLNVSSNVSDVDREDVGLDVGQIKLRLGDQEAVFDNGSWVPETGAIGGTHRENQKLRKCIQQLEDENNLLKLKFEILLDMMTQTTAKSYGHKKQIEELKKKVESSQGARRK